MILIFGRNDSWISRIIRWRTLSKWSHVGILWQGSVIESVGPSGVQLTPIEEFNKRYTATERRCLPGNPVKALAQVGKPFDLHGLKLILIGLESKRMTHWFCSDLVAYAAKHIPDTARKWVTPGILHKLSNKLP